jgi:hypothetical protein
MMLPWPSPNVVRRAAPQTTTGTSSSIARQSQQAYIPGGDTILKRFQAFSSDLSALCTELHLTATDLDNFRDFHNCVTEWLNVNAQPATNR